MKKILIAIALFLSFNLAKAQDLVKKIPANAFTVATIKGDNVFKLMFVKDFNESFVGKKLLTETSKSLDKSFTSIEDFGINLEKNMYYFNQLSDSITYNCFLIPIKDAKKFENLIDSKEKKFTQQGDIRTMVLPDSTSIIKWNNNMLYFVTGSIKGSFFADSVKSARYGIKDIRFQSDDAIVADSAAVAVDSAYATTDEPMVEAVDAPVVEKVKVRKKSTAKKNTKKTVGTKKTGKKKTAKKSKKVARIDSDFEEAREFAVDTASAMTPVHGIVDEQYDTYQQERLEQDAKKKRLAFTWMIAQADQIFTGSYESIENNKSYTASLDNKAIAELWVSSLQDVYNSISPEFGAYGKAGLMKGYGSLNAKLFMDDKSFRISTGLELAQEQADAYKKIMNRKLNKNFLKYVNSEKALGFMSYSIDTKAYLEEFPKLMKQTYGSLLGGKMDEEIDLGTELFSLLLDEEAVSKVIKGDALFVINGLNTKDVTYTTYEYDDDYKQKEIVKTKKETLPDFLFMFSSEDHRLINKLIKYGVNKNYVSVENNIYKVLEKKSPIDIYFMIKDGIVFFGNSLTEMQGISNNQYNSNKLSKLHKQLLSKNNFSFLFNAKNLVGKVPDSEIGGEETAKKFNSTLEKMGNVYMKSNPIKGRLVSADISAEIPNGHENALKYLFSLIENAAK
ncbi:MULTISPECIES: hypothetical protein [unclassified Pedobacter]|uniref:hypothetical protein n=1 Tax=unclassified Pedobacter TaxID=2628915 RepID=UPI001DBC5161|nr:MULTISPECIES: hypothetical protein [unclassified Pedobacter]CAH0153393.1 hypothetical protein SRABI126_00592 [Pedobacter sp. Bi126]CAH0204930.1 hypothetical protein SRABI36_02088 [Pedobacter sp. Bi36]